MELDEEDFADAARLAWRRDASFRRDTGFRSALYNHLQGCLAELAVARDLGLDIDEELYASEDGDGGYDFEVNGITIDVKSTSYDPPWLMVSEGRASADLFLSTHVDAGTVTLVGAAWAEEVRAAPTTANCHKLEADRLHDWPELGGPA